MTKTSELAVFFDGPQSDQNRDGDEIPLWVVFVGDENGDPVGEVHEFHNFDGAESLALRISRDRNIELVHEAMRD